MKFLVKRVFCPLLQTEISITNCLVCPYYIKETDDKVLCAYSRGGDTIARYKEFIADSL